MTNQTGRGFAVRAAATGPITFLASTNNLARDGLIIESNAWDLTNYRKNPSVLWSHDYAGIRPPIGRATDVRQESAGLVADIEFDQEDPFAVDIERKIRKGYINAVSVGWNTKEIVGNRVKRAELLDISVVPIPGDAGAIALARSAYVSGVRSQPSSEIGYTFQAVASTGKPDRHGETLDLDGLDLAWFRLAGSPIFLNHDTSQRIGTATRLWRDERGLMVDVSLDLTGQGLRAAHRVKAGDINAVSVGFRQKEKTGNTITRSVLEEISVGNGPIDGGAVIVSRSNRPLPSLINHSRNLGPAKWEVWSHLSAGDRADFNSIIANPHDPRHLRLCQMVRRRMTQLNERA